MIGETMICPKCGHMANHDSYFGAMVCRQCGWMRHDKPTNADRIRSMSDEELAEWISSIFDCHYDTSMCADFCNHNCDERHLTWLRQPAEE